ncbi:1725_t:CDS:2, partial [Entrophospora sp. SA101]
KNSNELFRSPGHENIRTELVVAFETSRKRFIELRNQSLLLFGFKSRAKETPDLKSAIKAINAIVGNYCGYNIKSKRKKVGPKGQQVWEYSYQINRQPYKGIGFGDKGALILPPYKPKLVNEIQELFDSIPITDANSKYDEIEGVVVILISASDKVSSHTLVSVSDSELLSTPENTIPKISISPNKNASIHEAEKSLLNKDLNIQDTKLSSSESKSSIISSSNQEQKTNHTIVQNIDVTELAPCSECDKKILTVSYEPFTILACGHTYHRYCIEKKISLTDSNICPIPGCNKSVEPMVSERRFSQQSSQSSCVMKVILISMRATT